MKKKFNHVFWKVAWLELRRCLQELRWMWSVKCLQHNRSNSEFTTKCCHRDRLQPNETVENLKNETSSEKPAFKRLHAHPSRICTDFRVWSSVINGQMDGKEIKYDKFCFNMFNIFTYLINDKHQIHFLEVPSYKRSLNTKYSCTL